MNLFNQLANRSSIIGQLFEFLSQRKNLWLLPVAAVIFLIGILFVLAQISSVAPWMYPL